MDNITLNLDKNLFKTFIIDIDGVIFYHNTNVLINGIKEFFDKNIKDGDKVILVTARCDDKKAETIQNLAEYGIKFDEIIFNLPTGERILINDKKPKGMITAFSINTDRNENDLNKIIILRENEV